MIAKLAKIKGPLKIGDLQYIDAARLSIFMTTWVLVFITHAQFSNKIIVPILVGKRAKRCPRSSKTLAPFFLRLRDRTTTTETCHWSFGPGRTGPRTKISNRNFGRPDHFNQKK